MSDLDYQFYPGRVRIGSVIISNGANKVDVTDLFVEFSLNTSIMSSSANGDLMLIDSTNLLAKYKVNAGDAVTMEVEYTDVTREFAFKIVSIESIDHQDKQRTYIVRCISQFAFVSNFRDIVGCFTGTTSQIAKGLFLENTDEKINIWEESVGDQKLVIPRWGLGYTVEWLARRSVWRDDSVRFRFFQDSKLKYNFMPIEKALQIYKNSPVMKYTHNLIASSNPNGTPNSAAVNSAIKSIEYMDSFDITNALKKGNITGVRFAPDIVNKSYSPLSFDYFDNFTKERYLNSYPQYKRGNYEQAVNQYSVSASDTQPGFGLNKISDISNFRTTTLDDSQNINIEVVGNQSVDIAQVVEIEIASPEPNTENRKSSIDTRWSGLYYIVAKRDVYSRDEHKMVLGLAKESQLERDNLS